MNNLRACWRLLRVLGHILKGLAIVAVRFPALSPDQQHARVQAWSLGLLTCAGITLQLRGRPQRAGPVLGGFFINLTPLFAAVLSTAFLGEVPQLYHGVAFLLIVGGIVVTSRRT